MTAWRVAIVGAGPAGLAAAMQLIRSGVVPQVYEHRQPGGLLRLAGFVENYPGFPRGISGPALAGRMTAQAMRLGVRLQRCGVAKLDWLEDGFRIRTDDGLESRTDCAVIATGTRPKPLQDVRIETGFRAVDTEPGDMLRKTGLRVAIIGGGDIAFDYALTLSRRHHVLILNRGSEPRCLPLLFDRAGSIPEIQYSGGVSIRRIGPSEDGRILVEGRKSDEPKEWVADRVLAAIGRIPETGFLGRSLLQERELLEQRGILLFAGDVKNGRFRQAAIAAGDGIGAAMKIHELMKGGPVT